jgi:hypothetical protein
MKLEAAGVPCMLIGIGEGFAIAEVLPSPRPKSEVAQ